MDKKTIITHWGTINLFATQKGLSRLFWQNKSNKGENEEQENTHLIQASHQLKLYFRGKLKKFCLNLDLQGSAFQMNVWKTIQQLPYGCTKTYQQIATEINRPKAYRAVGNAISKNPILIIIPCHRIIRSNGFIGEYAGGAPLKEKLLLLEKG